MATDTRIQEYDRTRPGAARGRLCHAPWVNLNFEQNGNVTACCFNRKDILGRYPDNSIREIWEGAAIGRLRTHIAKGKLDGGCKLCGILLDSGNFSGTKAKHYDEYASPRGLRERLRYMLPSSDRLAPKVFEFEISNTCNLGCVMCSGYFSSTIRKNRERLPPLANPYDEAFVRQVADFMPSLTDMKFLGGEPFLVDVYERIWEETARINPNIRVHITTNGTVLNNRVSRMLEGVRAGFVLSIDSIDPEEFAAIRVGADLHKVLSNLEYFQAIAKKKGTYVSIAACAMANNWKGIPNLVRFANEKGIHLHFNVVWNPGHLSLRYLTFDELSEVVNWFDAAEFRTDSPLHRANIGAFHELRQTVSHWREERRYTRLNNLDSFTDVGITDWSALSAIRELGEERRLLASLLLSQYLNPRAEHRERLSSLGIQNLADGKDPVRDMLFTQWKKLGDTEFLHEYFALLPVLARFFFGEEAEKLVEQRSRAINSHLSGFREQQAVISDLIDDIDRKSVVNHLQMIRGNEAEALISFLSENY